MSETQPSDEEPVDLFRVSWEVVEHPIIDSTFCMMTLNGDPVGPAVPDEATAEAVMRWFVGYLEQQVERQARAMLGDLFDPSACKVTTRFEGPDDPG